MSNPPASRGAAHRGSAAPYLLALSLLARFAVTYLVPNGTNFIDLHVYVDGAATMGDGGLYDFVYRPGDPAAAAAVHLSAVRRGGVLSAALPAVSRRGPGWQLGTVAALYGAAVLVLQLLGSRTPAQAMAWTALAIWFEPVRAPLRTRPGRRAADGRRALRGVQHPVVGVRTAGGAGDRDEADPCGGGRRTSSARAGGRVVGFSAVVFGATVAASIALGGGAGPVLLHRSARQRRPGRRGRHADESVAARRRGYVAGHDVGYGAPLLAAVASPRCWRWWRGGASGPTTRSAASSW